MKTILITGASRGIGAATARAFAAPGTRLVLVCKENKKQLDETIAAAKALGAEAFGFLCDLSNAVDTKNFFAKLDANHMLPEVLINNAGMAYFGLLQDMTDAEWNRILAVNLSSVFYCSRAVIPHMLNAGGGVIINVSSIWGSRGASCEAAYSATKGGLEALTRSLAKELAPSNIRVNAVSCGMIDTEMNSRLTEEEKRGFIESIPAGRMASADEVGRFIAHIANASEYMNGQVIGFDGAF
jgi:3-oxoacyl-[acyl-carrier protein] reductase